MTGFPTKQTPQIHILSILKPTSNNCYSNISPRESNAPTSNPTTPDQELLEDTFYSFCISSARKVADT